MIWSTVPFLENRFNETEEHTDEGGTRTDERGPIDEAAAYTMKDANDTRHLHHAIDSASNPTKKMRIPSGDTVTWPIKPSIKITVPFRHPEFIHLSAIQR